MKIFSSKIILIALLLTSLIPASGQSEGPEKLLGVNNGDTYEYVISQKFGLEGPLFSDGFNNMSLDEGETFQLTVVDDNPTIGDTIELEIWNDVVNVSYTNELNFFDFVVFKDWEFWQTLLSANGFDSYLDDEIFSFAYFLEDEVTGGVVYLEYGYQASTGVNTHQLVYVAPSIDQINNPISFLQINLGSTALPLPDPDFIGFKDGSFYTYEAIQVQGYGSNPVFEGLDDGLSLSTGDSFLVSPLSDTPGAGDAILATIQSDGEGIVYQNRLDFQNSVNSPGFFVYNDWEYVEDFLLREIQLAKDGLTIKYELTSDEFIYEEDYTHEAGYYSLEQTYERDTGVLIYQSFITENTVLSTVNILEFTLRDTLEIDETLVSFELKGDYEYKLTKYKPVSNTDPLFQTTGDSLFIFEDDTFTISPENNPDEFNLIPIRVSSESESILIFNQLDGLGSFFVYPDWEFWTATLDLLTQFSVPGLTISYENDDDTFTINRIIDSDTLQSDEEMVYNKKTGVLKSYKYAAIGQNTDGSSISLIIEFELKKDPGSDEDDGPAFLYSLGLIALVTSVIIRKKIKK